ncbi:MAG: hypothetical protein Q7T05_04505, partial [Dehalococcoidia bacterium]|nr:hypothetical protein [Dehalococcoidia bacterium]
MSRHGPDTAGIGMLDNGDVASYYGKVYKIQTSIGGNDRLNFKYWWDADGNLSTRTDVVATETESFSYDLLDRLTAVSGAYSESYAYDILGNIMDMNGTSYTYGAKPHAVTSVGAYTQSYDGNGNMTGRANSTGTQTLTFDVENRLSQVQGTGGGYS